MPARAVRIHPLLDRALVPAATLLMGVVGLVLALVCSNLAIMLLLRGASKHREISIRMAMGAGRSRIVRQLLTESLVLSCCGGLVGCVAAIWLLDSASATDLPSGLPLGSGLARLSVDVGVLAFAIEIPGAVVAPGYFDSLGIQIVRGRALRPQDDRSAPPVAVINEAMARRFWGTVDVVGRRYRHDGQPDSWVEIVGVAADVKVTSLTEEGQPQVYRSWDQTGWPVASYILRTAGNPSEVVSTIAAAVRGFDSRLPVTQLVTMDDYIDRQLLLPRMAAGVLSGFGFTALVLAALGLYAVVAFAVRERMKEIGIRLALGASGPGVVWTVVRAVMATVTVGLAVGLLAALGAGRALSTVLFNVSPSDPAALLAGMLILALVAIAAAVIPAMRATRVDSSTVLRYQ